MNTWHDGMMAWYISERVAFVDFGIARGDSKWLARFVLFAAFA